MYCFSCGVASPGVLRLATVSLILFLSSTPVFAVPDITGTYTGQLSGEEFCQSGNDGSLSVSFQLTFSQSGNTFTASGTATEADGGVADIKLKSGTINNDGSFSAQVEGTLDDGDQLSGSVSGTLNNDSITVDISYIISGNDPCQGFLQGTLTRSSGGDIVVNPEETPSSTVTNTILNTIQVQSVTSNVSGRVGDVLRGGGRGVRRTSTGMMFEETIKGRNAGDGISSFGLWSSYSYSDFDNDLSSTALDGSRHSILAGVDISPWEKTVFGVAVGYENSDIDTLFNRGNQQSDGITIAPYAGFLLTDLMSVDASVGYSHVDIEQYRTDPTTGARISSDAIADRWFAMANFNLFKSYRQWFFGAQLGHLYMRNTQDAFTESNGAFQPERVNKLSQLHVSGDVAYSMGQFEPFARVTYEYDYSITKIRVVGGGAQPSNDRDGVVLGLGVRYFSSGGISGNLEWNKRLDRDNFDEDSIMMTIRGEF